MANEGAFVEVRELLGPELSDIGLEVRAGAKHLSRRIVNPRVQKPGLAFAGHYKYIKPEPSDPVAYAAYQSRLKTRRDTARRIVQQYHANKIHIYPIPLRTIGVAGPGQTLASFLPPTVRARNQPFGAGSNLENRWVFVPSYVARDGRRISSHWRQLTVPKR